MKTKHCFLIVLFVFSHLFSFSQYQYDNEYDVNPPAGGTKSIECSGNSDAYQNRYNVIANYIPELSTPSKVIKVNIIVMQDDSGGNNFQHDDPLDDTGDLYSILNIFENLCIHKMDNMYPSDPISGVVDFSNPHFEFSLNNVYFYKSTIGNNSTTLGTLTNIIENNNPESVHYVNNYNDLPSQLNEVNIFFTQATSGASNANLPEDVDIDSPVRCVIRRAYTQGAWAVSGGIAHELGHNVDLCHTYLGGGCPTSISSMNSSENWFPDLFGDTYPGNAPHITSYCSPSWSDCPPITYEWDDDPFDNTLPMADRLTNNIMGNQGNTRNYLSPLQIGRVHRALSLKSIRRFVIDNCYDSNNPILVNSDEIWDFNIRIYQDLIIDNNSECNIKCHLELPYQAKIVVKSGSSLIVEGSITGVNETNWQGQIEVEPGGELILNDGAELKFGDGGNILIDQSGSLAGNLIYNENALIILEESTSFLELKGQLHIGTNATFTYTGDGYIKFSNPGNDNTQNITCGSGASIVLQGSGQSDKIMEVQQSSVRFPAELSSLELRDGKIEMGAYARLLNEVVSGNADYPITLDNIKITSDDGTHNNHRSYFFWGQPNITINDCVFEYGQFGLYNYTYWGSPLTVTNSTFRDNQVGLYMYDKGLTLTNCIFDDNTQVGLHADNMSFVSDLDYCTFNYNQLAIDYQGSANADLFLDYCNIQNSTNDGVRTYGSFDLRPSCTGINYNQNGILTAYGTRVRVSRGAKNNFSNNVNAIYLNYGTLDAKYGYNNFQSTNYAIKGETPHFCAPPLSPKLDAHCNLWDGTNHPAYLQNHKLWVLNCSQTPVNIIDPIPQAQMCWPISKLTLNTSLSADNQDTDIQLSDESTSGSLTSQVDAAYEATSELNTAAECQQLLSESITLMENVYGIETAEAYYQSNRIWSNIHNVIDKHYKIIGRDNENMGFNQSVDQVMQLNAQLMLDADAIAYYEYALDNALLERLRGNFDESLLLLDNLIPELEGMGKEIAYVNRWICHIEAERAAALRNITPEEFMEAVAICDTDYENTLESLSDNLQTDENAEETSTAPEIHIVPNPNNGNFTLEISECTEGSSVRITNVYSQPVFTQTFTGSGTQTVQITGLSQGHYTVYYLENDTVISSENIVVE